MNTEHNAEQPEPIKPTPAADDTPAKANRRGPAARRAEAAAKAKADARAGKPAAPKGKGAVRKQAAEDRAAGLGADADPPCVETGEHLLESLAGLTEQVFRRHLGVLEDQLSPSSVRPDRPAVALQGWRRRRRRRDEGILCPAPGDSSEGRRAFRPGPRRDERVGRVHLRSERLRRGTLESGQRGAEGSSSF